MKVSEAVRHLTEMEQGADLMICAHGFEGKEGMAWNVTHFEDAESANGAVVLVEGAGETGEQDGTDDAS